MTKLFLAVQSITSVLLDDNFKLTDMAINNLVYAINPNNSNFILNIEVFLQKVRKLQFHRPRPSAYSVIAKKQTSFSKFIAKVEYLNHEKC